MLDRERRRVCAFSSGAVLDYGPDDVTTVRQSVGAKCGSGCFRACNQIVGRRAIDSRGTLVAVEGERHLPDVAGIHDKHVAAGDHPPTGQGPGR